jgi:tagatose-1,6-bisphosphate aldolase
MEISSLKTSSGLFCLVEFDDEAKFIDSLGLDLQDPEGKKIVQQIIDFQIEAYSGAKSKNPPGMSGFILDPELSLKSFLKQKIEMGIGLNLDQLQAEHDPLSLPKLIDDWGVDQIKNNYGVATLTFYYHPEESQALKKKQFLAETQDYCKYVGIDLVVKLVVYTPGDRKFDWEEFRKDQLQAIEELRDLAQLFILQHPNDSLACATLTTKLDVPWVMSDNNLEYEDFKEKLRDALENGASGFVAGESLFKEIEGMRKNDHSPDEQRILEFVKMQSRDRAIELVRIANEYGELN